MAHVLLPPGIPGIRGPLTQFPDTAGPLLDLAQALLRGPSPLSPGQRELIATAVSVGNRCAYCSQSHGAAARELLGRNHGWVDDILSGTTPADLPPMLGALLALAERVRQDGHQASDAVEAARASGAGDREIHDTVLIAAAFSLYNRYVDGLGTPVPDPAAYEAIGKRLAQQGYR